MKKVFTSSSDVIHLFANQLQDEARASNVFFNKTKIYSYGYHYLLGEFIDSNTILINDSGYSVTTAKHIRELTYATSHKKQFFTTETDLKSVLHAIRANVRKLQTARKPELYVLPSLRLFDKLNYFIGYTGKKELLKSIEYKEIKILIDAINKDPKHCVNELKKFDAKRAKIESKIKSDQLKKEKKEFKTFKRDRLNIGGTDFLRLSKDGLFIETSQSVKVGINEAKRLLNLIDAKKIIGAKVNDSYIVTAFNGVLRAGCHNIPINEINEIKELLK